MKKIVKIIGIIILSIIVLCVGLIALAYLSNRTIDQTIATDLAISADWQELTPNPPLSVNRQIQELNLTIEGFRHDRSAGLPFTIKLPNGTVVNPEIEIYDDKGNRYELKHVGFVMKYTDDIVFQPLADLPDNRTYPMLRVRSDIPFMVSRMYWRNSNLK